MWVWSLGQGDPLEEGMATQYLWLENPMVRGVLEVMVHGVAQSRTRLKQLSTHACIQLPYNVVLAPWEFCCERLKSL